MIFFLGKWDRYATIYEKERKKRKHSNFRLAISSIATTTLKLLINVTTSENRNFILELEKIINLHLV